MLHVFTLFVRVCNVSVGGTGWQACGYQTRDQRDHEWQKVKQIWQPNKMKIMYFAFFMQVPNPLLQQFFFLGSSIHHSFNKAKVYLPQQNGN